MTKAEKTRSFIIQTSAPIFNTKGYSGTSLNDITEATGLTKGAIYGNFEDKDAIALAVYKHNVSAVKRGLAEVVDAKGKAIDKLMASVNFYRNNWEKIFNRGGCAILNTSVEADDAMPFMKSAVQITIKAWAESIAEMIELGKKQNEIKKDINAKDYAYLFITLIEGGIMMAKVTDEPSHLLNALSKIEDIITKELKEFNFYIK
jgi:TetR/AcrR family transcriptional repressor of nem operon